MDSLHSFITRALFLLRDNLDQERVSLRRSVLVRASRQAERTLRQGRHKGTHPLGVVGAGELSLREDAFRAKLDQQQV